MRLWQLQLAVLAATVAVGALLVAMPQVQLGHATRPNSCAHAAPGLDARLCAEIDEATR